MSLILKNKKILFICNRFFNYENTIKEGMESLGAIVTFIDGRPSSNFLGKAFIRFFPKFNYKKALKYFDFHTKNISTNFDYLLVIAPECMNADVFNKIKSNTNPQTTILHMWDTFENRKQALELLPLFDKISSFDYYDSKKYDMFFRANFYRTTKQEKGNNYKYDLSFAGTGHSDRASIVKKIEYYCTNNNINFYHRLYLQSKLVYLFNKLTNKAFKGIKSSFFKYTPIPFVQFQQLAENSKVFLDIEHPKQTGLTMKTFDMMAINKKIITTNKTIQHYDFYNPNNICIIDRNNPIIPKKIFDTPFEPVPEEILYKYSIEGWIEDLFLN